MNSWRRALLRRYRARLVLGLLVVTVPVLVLIVTLLTWAAGTHIRTETETVVANRATAVAGALDDYLAERRLDMAVVATAVADHPLEEAGAQLAEFDRLNDSFDGFAVVGLDGRTLVRGDGETVAFADPEATWFRDAVAGRQTLSEVFERDGAVHWYAAHPVLGPDGRVQSVLVGRLLVGSMGSRLAAVNFGRTAEVVVVDRERTLVTSSRAGADATEEALLASGSTRTRADTVQVRGALAGDSGALASPDYRGVEVYAGYAPAAEGRWAVVAKKDRAEAMEAVRQQGRSGLLLGLLGAAMIGLFGYLFARRESAYLRHVVDGLGAVGSNVTTSATELSSASEELAATTAQQSAAVTQTSATMEELARTSAVIAETVERVAGQLVKTRDQVELAQAGITATSERTHSLSTRVYEISGILGLIREIADQTNLLALNASIEAARAGENGRGFAVVADEVQRLAERSKASAAQIEKIVQSAQAENSSTVLAMENGTRQLSESLALIEAVAVGGDQVRLTTQQQRMATEQVVTSMEQINAGSRQVSTTARQISAAAAAMTGAARDLGNAAAETRERF
ncbi:hypothetical protein NUM3379_25340 [Kineococcus sp. NUM-3379]